MTDKPIVKKEDSLFALIREGNPTNIEQIKESVTGPLCQYIIGLIEKGDTKRADTALKLLDLIHKHSKSADNEPNDVAMFVKNFNK